MMGGLMLIADAARTTSELVSATIADSATAVAVILAMSFGLMVPKMVIDYFSDYRDQSRERCCVVRFNCFGLSRRNHQRD
jgi:hypothetical protein